MVNLGEVAAHLKAARIKLGLSQEEAATKIGVSRSTIQRCELGEIVNIQTLDRIIVGYGLELAEVLSSESDLAYLKRVIKRLGPHACGIICTLCENLDWK